MTCLAKNVPNTSSKTFDGSYIEYATLHVPDKPQKGINIVRMNDGKTKKVVVKWYSLKKTLAAAMEARNEADEPQE